MLRNLIKPMIMSALGVRNRQPVCPCNPLFAGGGQHLGARALPLFTVLFLLGLASTSGRALLSGVSVTTPIDSPYQTSTPMAATITVKSNADAGGTCPGSTCTLRQAIATANAGDTINFDMTMVVSPITLTSGELLINKNLTIQGPGANLLTVSGNNSSRVFEINSGVTATISGLTIGSGKATGANGGGILNNGTLTLTSSTLSNNSTTSTGNGGGIFNSGAVTITSSTLLGNTAGGNGGGLYNTGTGTITNSTISGNMATGGGGILNNSGTLNIASSTIANNSATCGGGLRNNGTVNIKNSILANNTGGDCQAPVITSFSRTGPCMGGTGTNITWASTGGTSAVLELRRQGNLRDSVSVPTNGSCNGGTCFKVITECGDTFTLIVTGPGGSVSQTITNN